MVAEWLGGWVAGWLGQSPIGNRYVFQSASLTGQRFRDLIGGAIALAQTTHLKLPSFILTPSPNRTEASGEMRCGLRMSTGKERWASGDKRAIATR